MTKQDQRQTELKDIYARVQRDYSVKGRLKHYFRKLSEAARARVEVFKEDVSAAGYRNRRLDNDDASVFQRFLHFMFTGILVVKNALILLAWGLLIATVFILFIAMILLGVSLNVLYRALPLIVVAVVVFFLLKFVGL